MECDWEFEIAPDAPVIDGAWSGYVDLRTHPERASRLAEVEGLPALAQTLSLLNAADTPLWTAKCDVWEPEAFDADELDAPHEDAAKALACYIDLLPSVDLWLTIDAVADWCRRMCATLRARPLRCCRVDLVIRRSFLAAGQAGLGVTAYLTACGAASSVARESLSAALALFADTVQEFKQTARD
jgi:hypothetical protein